MSVIEKFVKEIEKTDNKEEIQFLENLWRDKIVTFPSTLKLAEEIDGDILHLYVLKGAEAILLHKPTGIFIYITNITAVELETLRYITIRKKGKEANNDFVSIAHEYLSLKNKGKIGSLK
ncbi:hypothetical protein [Saccharolobus caldissimus]|uniref:Uncharacterized protein n=1 Tax=Saccharolobus caldissimus TaxID=1702097 RepID=A0AAQ4CT14_9CREN|nr:hypothetical protein [Saccharolobus caldissimus]BDB98945.1 hypothetical protein SACC_19620 [Saccharolobus caldissimus]